MRKLFVDASYWIALELTDDQNHNAAQSDWNLLDLNAAHLLTTTYILDEAVTFLNSRNAHRNAVELGESILLSQRIELIYVDADLFFDGWQSFKKYSDKRFSLTDCISFLVMRDRNLSTALTFDGDFEQAGFVTEPLKVTRLG